ncbi:MAG: HTH domain-containing protein [Thomasclavelia sp.]|nr:HTH domain-containing protein [Thomasclavelia sp.]
MVFEKNEIQIIKLLLGSADYISSYDIAVATKINRRLVREKINDIKKILKTYNCELASKASKGYLIVNKSAQALSSLTKALNDSEKERDTLFPTLPEERQNYIIQRLIETNDYIKLDDLAEELLVSRSTISNDLTSVRKYMIKKYNLVLKQRPNYGIRIIGKEKDLREPLIDNNFANLNKSNMLYDYLDNFLIKENTLENSIITIIKNNHIEINDISLCDFLISLSTSIYRYSSGFEIEEPFPKFEQFKTRSEYQAALQIVAYLKEKGVSLSEYELQNITILLVTKRSTSGLDLSNDHQIIKIFNEVKDEIYDKTLIRINNTTALILNKYIYIAILRLFYNEKLRTPLYEEAPTNNPIAYELARITDKVIYKYTNKHFNRSELSAFTLMYNTMIQSNNETRKKVLLVCSLANVTSDLCLFKLKENFNSQLEIVKSTPYYKITDEDLSKYDLIISTSHIHRNLPIPNISISPMISNDDLNTVRNYLNYSVNYKHFLSYFHPKFYDDNITKTTRDEIFNSFNNCFARVYKDNRDSLIHKLSSSQYTLKPINDKIGIIKLDKTINSNNTFIIQIYKNPITFDNYHVQILILFSAVDSSHNIYNTLLQLLNKMVSKEDEYKELITNPSYTKFLNLLLNDEKKLC